MLSDEEILEIFETRAVLESSAAYRDTRVSQLIVRMAEDRTGPGSTAAG